MSTLQSSAMIFVLGVGLSGCSSAGRVQTIPSPDVDRIPASIAVYPVLSTKEVIPARFETYGAVDPRARNLSGSGERKQVYIAPPADSELMITQPSQILTSELSAEMARSGFRLKELPYEVVTHENGEKSDYVISLDLLDRMREEYGLDAIVVGNAFFVGGPGFGWRETRITAAYLKVIDTETLDVLCQVTMSYDPQGRDLNQVAAELADELTKMAGLVGE